MSWSINRVIALVIGVVFLLIGIIGFFTPTENSTGVQAVFNTFDVDTVHNIFYVIVGALGVLATFTGYDRQFNQIFGIVFLLIGLLGLIPALYSPRSAYGTDGALFLGLTHMNAGDHILHLIAGALAAGTGFFLKGSASHPRAVA